MKRPLFIAIIVLCAQHLSGNEPPEFVSAPVEIVEEFSTYLYQVVVADPDQEDTLTISIVEKPDWLWFDDSGKDTALLYGTPAAFFDSAYVSLQVTDGMETAIQSFTIKLHCVNSSPQFITSPETSARADSLYEYQMIGTDACSNVVFDSRPLPDWLTLNNVSTNNAVLSGIPSRNDTGVYTIQIEVRREDEICISRSYQIFKISVIDSTGGGTGFSKLTVDLGKDTVFCAGFYPDTMRMRDNIIIENGTEPYTYAWECTKRLTHATVLTASDYLSDTTILNPYFKNWDTGSDIDWVKFYLHVTDSTGAYGMDSINIGFSGCICPLGYDVIEIHKGDSILLDAGGPYGKYVKFYWVPAYGLSDPDSSVTWCRPEVSTSYLLAKIDSIGCTCTCHRYDIWVLPASVDESDLGHNNQPEIFQAGTKVYFSNPLHKEAGITLYSADGRAFRSFKTTGNHFDISGVVKTKGIYPVTIKLEGHTINGRIVFP